MNRFVRPGVVLRLLAWVAACAALPACSDDIDGGDHIDTVTTRVSLNKDDEQPLDFGCSQASSSEDGMTVAFVTPSSQIAPGVPSTASPVPSNVVVKDRGSRIAVRASVRSDPGTTLVAPGSNGASFSSQVSPDGSAVVFITLSKLVNGAAVPSTGASSNLYVRDLTTNLTKPVIDPDIWPTTGIGSCSLTVITTPVERYALVAFTTASNIGLGLPSQGPPPSNQVYLSKVMLSTNAIPTLTLVSHDTASPTTFANLPCSDVRISNDGSAIAFASNATNLDANKTDGAISDIFVATQLTAVPSISLISYSPAGPKSSDNCVKPAISKDGRYVTFYSEGDNMVPSGTNLGNIFRRDRGAGAVAASTELVSRDAFGVQANFACGLQSRISSDGSKIVFTTNATNLLPNTTSGFTQVYLRDFSAGTLSIVSVNRSGAMAELDCLNPEISGNGRCIFWDTVSGNLVPADTNGIRDIFVRSPTQP